MPGNSEADKCKDKGNEFFKTGEYQTAIRHYTNAIVIRIVLLQKIDGQNSFYYSNRARCHKLLENYKEASEDAQKCIEIDMTNLKGHLLLGESLCMLAKNAKNISQIDKAIERMKKALSLCTSKDVREYEIDISNNIRKARKLKWILQREETVKENQKLFDQAKVAFSDPERDRKKQQPIPRRNRKEPRLPQNPALARPTHKSRLASPPSLPSFFIPTDRPSAKRGWKQLQPQGLHKPPISALHRSPLFRALKR